MDWIHELGGWALIASVGCLWVLRFIDSGRVKALEDERVKDGEQEPCGAGDFGDEPDGVSDDGGVEPAQGAPSEPAPRAD